MVRLYVSGLKPKDEEPLVRFETDPGNNLLTSRPFGVGNTLKAFVATLGTASQFRTL